MAARGDGTFQRAHLEFAPAAAPTFLWLETGVLSAKVRLYIGLAVNWLFPGAAAGGRAGAQGLPGAARCPAAPAIPGRICREDNSPLEQVRVEAPRFVETSYFLARLVVAVAVARKTAGEGTRAADGSSRAVCAVAFGHISLWAIQSADRRLPGGARFLRRDDRDKVVHEDAWLGRTMCLTFLKRSQEAIAAATVIVDGSSTTWRSDSAGAPGTATSGKNWSSRATTSPGPRRCEPGPTSSCCGHHRLRPARSDAGAGRLDSALEMEAESCPASWYFGLVHMDLKKFAESAAFFESAMDCYEREYCSANRR